MADSFIVAPIVAMFFFLLLLKSFDGDVGEMAMVSSLLVVVVSLVHVVG